MKNGSRRYDINRPRLRPGYKYTKYKKWLSVMIVIRNKEHLSKICSSIHDKIK